MSRSIFSRSNHGRPNTPISRLCGSGYSGLLRQRVGTTGARRARRGSRSKATIRSRISPTVSRKKARANSPSHSTTPPTGLRTPSTGRSLLATPSDTRHSSTVIARSNSRAAARSRPIRRPGRSPMASFTSFRENLACRYFKNSRTPLPKRPARIGLSFARHRHNRRTASKTERAL